MSLCPEPHITRSRCPRATWASAAWPHGALLGRGSKAITAGPMPSPFWPPIASVAETWRPDHDAGCRGVPQVGVRVPRKGPAGSGTARKQADYGRAVQEYQDAQAALEGGQVGEVGEDRPRSVPRGAVLAQHRPRLDSAWATGITTRCTITSPPIPSRGLKGR